MVSLQFLLAVEEGWPPVGSESLPFECADDGFRCLVSPLFVSDLSVGDEITAVENNDGFVDEWKHLVRSGRSTIWILRLSSGDNIASVLDELRSMGCNTISLDAYGCYSVDIPAELSFEMVDDVLNELSPDTAAVAFPSFRHKES